MIFRKPRLQTTTSRRSHEHTFLGALSLAGSCGGLGLGVSPKPLPACKTGRLRLLNGAALVSRLLTRNAGTGRTSVVNMIAVADAARLIRAMSSTSLLQHLEVCVCVSVRGEAARVRARVLLVPLLSTRLFKEFHTEACPQDCEGLQFFQFRRAHRSMNCVQRARCT